MTYRLPHMPDIVGSHDIVFITLDTLRFDVAQQTLAEDRTPAIARVLPHGWEPRHSPGTFTYAAHAAFFAGFLPTPMTPGPHDRMFAMAFPRSETTAPQTAVFDAPDLVHGLQNTGYHTICIGGTGFFNKQTPLGRTLPGLFETSVWDPSLGVTDPHSAQHQIEAALKRLTPQRTFLFINFSALHQPNCCYVDGATSDSAYTQAAALAYVDSQLPPLLDTMRQRGPSFWIICADHGTAYGEDGYVGHRHPHPVVTTVPYAHFVLQPHD